LSDIQDTANGKIGCPPAYIVRIYAKGLLYIPTVFGYRSMTGIVSFRKSFNFILVKNDASKLNPPYAVIFFVVNSIPTLISVF